ncbi:MAG: L,D-transpeptidase [Catenulispora sp.]|nr:L,D-transpeptidase [Catenulispora sp.]
MGNKLAGAAVAGSLLLLTGCASTAVNHSATPGPTSSAPEASTAASSTTTTTSSAAPATVSTTTGGPSTAASKPSTSAAPTTTTTTNQSTGTGALPSISSVTPRNGSKVGVAMPVRVNFASTVPSTDRATIEKTMKVTTTPHVDGAWSWLDANTADFRPQGFVQFGSTGRTLDFTIGDDHEIVVDAATHNMKVYENGALVKTLASGTGKPGLDTYSGTMAVMDMVPHIEMTSCALGIQCTKGGPGWYDLQTYHDLQLTDSGTFIHSAWWDNSLGKANISHGCIHLSEADAAALWNIVQVGDPVTVKGTIKKVSQSNGYADYTLSWSQWLSNSATGIQVF